MHNYYSTAQHHSSSPQRNNGTNTSTTKAMKHTTTLFCILFVIFQSVAVVAQPLSPLPPETIYTGALPLGSVSSEGNGVYMLSSDNNLVYTTSTDGSVYLNDMAEDNFGDPINKFSACRGSSATCTSAYGLSIYEDPSTGDIEGAIGYEYTASSSIPAESHVELLNLQTLESAHHIILPGRLMGQPIARFNNVYAISWDEGTDTTFVMACCGYPQDSELGLFEANMTAIGQPSGFVCTNENCYFSTSTGKVYTLGDILYPPLALAPLNIDVPDDLSLAAPLVPSGSSIMFIFARSNLLYSWSRTDEPFGGIPIVTDLGIDDSSARNHVHPLTLSSTNEYVYVSSGRRIHAVCAASASTCGDMGDIAFQTEQTSATKNKPIVEGNGVLFEVEFVAAELNEYDAATGESSTWNPFQCDIDEEDIDTSGPINYPCGGDGVGANAQIAISGDGNILVYAEDGNVSFGTSVIVAVDVSLKTFSPSSSPTGSPTKSPSTSPTMSPTIAPAPLPTEPESGAVSTFRHQLIVGWVFSAVVLGMLIR